MFERFFLPQTYREAEPDSYRNFSNESIQCDFRHETFFSVGRGLRVKFAHICGRLVYFHSLLECDEKDCCLFSWDVDEQVSNLRYDEDLRFIDV